MCLEYTYQKTFQNLYDLLADKSIVHLVYDKRIVKIGINTGFYDGLKNRYISIQVGGIEYRITIIDKDKPLFLVVTPDTEISYRVQKPTYRYQVMRIVYNEYLTLMKKNESLGDYVPKSF